MYSMKFRKNDRFYDLESLRQIFMNVEYILRKI